MDDNEVLRELASRLDHIEDYLERLGRVQGLAYPRFRGTISAGPGFHAAPASFGPLSGFSDGIPGGFSGPSAPSQAVPSGPGSRVPDEIVMLARSGKLIEAIKQYRSLTNLGLKQAKDEVDAAMRQPR
jgi:hypothetical protein